MIAKWVYRHTIDKNEKEDGMNLQDWFVNEYDILLGWLQ